MPAFGVVFNVPLPKVAVDTTAKAEQPVLEVFRISPDAYAAGGGLVLPSLYVYLEAALKIHPLTTVVPYAALLGTLMVLGPGEGESPYVGVFGHPQNHPRDSGDERTPPATLFLAPAVVDVLVNGGVLMGSDNVCYGVMDEGVVSSIVAFVEER